MHNEKNNTYKRTSDKEKHIHEGIHNTHTHTFTHVHTHTDNDEDTHTHTHTRHLYTHISAAFHASKSIQP
jgi:hypothetical protein